MATEALKVALTATMSNSEVDLLTVASGHTVAVLSVLLCETAGAAETFDLYAVSYTHLTLPTKRIV